MAAQPSARSPREAFGRFSVTNIDYSAGQATGTWSYTNDTVRDNAVNNVCVNNSCYTGKHGGRDDITWHGYRFSLQEAQDTGSRLGDYTTWRFVLYDYTNDQAYPVSATSSINSPCHGNPKLTTLTNVNGQSVILITAFIFSECAATGEAGELLYQVPAQ